MGSSRAIQIGIGRYRFSLVLERSHPDPVDLEPPATPSALGCEADTALPLRGAGRFEQTLVDAEPGPAFWPAADDEDDADDLPAPYSLAQRLRAEPPPLPLEIPAARAALQVLRYRDEQVRELATVRRGGVYRLRLERASRRGQLGLTRHCLARLRRDGEVEVRLAPGLRVLKGADGGNDDDGAAVVGRGGILRLSPGQSLVLRHGQEEILLRFSRPPALDSAIRKRGRRTSQERQALRTGCASVGSSLAAHTMLLAALFLLGLVSPPPQARALASDDWVDISDKDIDDLIPSKPAEQLPIVELADARPTPELREPRPRPASRLARPEDRSRRRGLLGALDKVARNRGALGDQTLVAALGNVDVVKVPGGNPSYKMSGLAVAGPRHRVRIGGAGGGVDTVGLGTLRRRGGRPGEMAKVARSAVRSRIKLVSRGFKPRGPGGLSREQIQKVVNRNLGKIQFCYERELVRRQSLSGKVVFNWTIAPSGQVSVVKTRLSTLGDARAVRCMVDSIRGWKFPRPSGNGAVEVTYPILFDPVAY